MSQWNVVGMPSHDLQPPKCGERAVKKLLGKKPKGPKFHLYGGNSYNDIVSLEEPQDTASFPSQASNANKIHGANVKPRLPHVVQFEPSDLEQIKKEKEEAEAKAKAMADLLSQPARMSAHSLESATKRPTRTLPPVERKPRESLGEATKALSALDGPPVLARSEDSSEYLPVIKTGIGASTSSTSFSSSNNRSTDTDMVIHSIGSTTKNIVPDKSFNSSSPGSTFSLSEQMELITALREVVLKQQDAIKELSLQNDSFRTSVLSYQEELKETKQENTEQEARITRLLLQKEAFASESHWLRAEVKHLKDEMGDLKTDDDKLLAKQFESLMVDKTESQSDSDDDSLSSTCEFKLLREKGSLVSAESGPELSPNSNDAINLRIQEYNRSFDEETECRRNLSSSKTKEGGAFNKPSSLRLPKHSGKGSEESEITVDSESATESIMTSEATMYNVQRPSNAGRGKNIDEDRNKKEEEMEVFRSRLDQIQKKRRMQKESWATIGRKALVRFQV